MKILIFFLIVCVYVWQIYKIPKTYEKLPNNCLRIRLRKTLFYNQNCPDWCVKSFSFKKNIFLYKERNDGSDGGPKGTHKPNINKQNVLKYVCNWKKCRNCPICIVKSNKNCQTTCPISQYRISDMFRGTMSRNLKRKKNTTITLSNMKRWIHTCWPKSIMSEYFNLAKDYGNIEILKKIANKRIQNTSSDTVLHIRGGDTITNASKQWHEYTGFNSNNNRRIYVFPKDYYKKIIAKLKVGTQITIVVSTVHWTKAYDENIKYINYVYDFFKKSGFNMSLRLNQGTPDEDLVFMSNTKIFIQGGGGYSSLISKLVEKNGNQKIVCNFGLMHRDVILKKKSRVIVIKKYKWIIFYKLKV